METRGRAVTSIFTAPATTFPLMQHPLSAGEGGLNCSTSQIKALNETLASNEPPLQPTDPNANKTIYDFQVLDCFHELYDLAQHKGSVVLICNVASKDKEYTQTGYTTLTKLFNKHRSEGVTVLAFPCNEFGNGEPGNEDEIAENISNMFPHIGEVDFPIMAKIEVNGDHASPLFTFLKSRIRGTLNQTSVSWNFTVFLCDQTGVPYARFAPESTMAEIDARIEELLHPKVLPAPAEPLASSLPGATMGIQQQSQAVALSGEAPGAEDASPPENCGCATPPPSGVVPPPSTTVTDVTSHGSRQAIAGAGEESDSMANGSSSAAKLRTMDTLEGAKV
ncbi:putative glutathione peroxidase-like protein [Leptomonas seymouri]|uniref:Glutathione peroxidase n=1 Tax=Leptomonas seymouri TaxID=5684 RepID=A0A0N0P533_LEPSE|nr:putative glutathione peroxidase-like protein [Leptomonas seymouri]|eukprot:KPI85996.1 putative glutathione peroxidase-like protein [Leptomonas seymouri]